MIDEYQIDTSCESQVEVLKALRDDKGKGELLRQLQSEIALYSLIRKTANKPFVIPPATFLKWINALCETGFTNAVLGVLEWFHVLMPICKEINSVNPEQLSQIALENDEDYFRALISIPPKHIPPDVDGDIEAAVVRNPHWAFAHGNIELDGKDVTPAYHQKQLYIVEGIMKFPAFREVKTNPDMYKVLANLRGEQRGLLTKLGYNKYFVVDRWIFYEVEKLKPGCKTYAIAENNCFELVNKQLRHPKFKSLHTIEQHYYSHRKKYFLAKSRK